MAAGILLVLPAAASAATTCVFGSGVLSVALSAEGDLVQLEVASDGEIVVSQSSGTRIICAGGPPSVTNTNAIDVSGNVDFTHVIVHAASRFAPGANTVGENGGTPEIEIFVNLHDARESRLSVGTDALGGSIRFGTDGINSNATAAEVQPDVDIFPSRVRNIRGIGGPGPDTLDARGGADTGNALPQPIVLDGGAGADRLTGGERADTVIGGIDNDELSGLGGNDFLVPGRHNDTMDGGTGSDFALYLGHPSGVAVDLAIAGPQNTGASALDSLVGVEHILGTDFADVLRGDDGPNALHGFDGNDVLEGRGGVDALDGQGGEDALEVRDGGPDEALCGSETDTVTADAPGIDTLTECENSVFPVVDPPPAPPPGDAPPPDAPPSGTGPAGPPVPIAAADITPPAFLGASNARPSSFAVVRGGGTAFRYRLSEAARVVFAIERRARGRRVGARCRRQTRSNGRRRACVRFVRVGTFAQRARAGSNRKRFSGRIGGRRLAPGSYRATLVATDVAGNRSRATRVAFKVVRR